MIAPLRRTARGLVRAGLELPGVDALLVGLDARLRRAHDELAVLTYHRVAPRDPDADLAPGLISVTPDELDRHVAWFRRRAAVVHLGDVHAARARRRLPRRALLLTFDDGYADFAEHAWPRLRAAGLAATLFVATAAPAWADPAGVGPDQRDDARGFWWDRLHAALGRTTASVATTPAGRVDLDVARRDPAAFAALTGRLKALSHAELLDAVTAIERLPGEVPSDEARTTGTLGWPALRRLVAEGVTVAPHTRTHPLLTRIPIADAEAEIAGSRADLERHLPGSSLTTFAYPSGAHDDRTVRLVERLGLELAFTTQRGTNRLGRSDRLRLRRYNVGAFARRPGGLAAQLTLGHIGAARGRGSDDADSRRRKSASPSRML